MDRGRRRGIEEGFKPGIKSKFRPGNQLYQLGEVTEEGASIGPDIVVSIGQAVDTPVGLWRYAGGDGSSDVVRSGVEADASGGDAGPGLHRLGNLGDRLLERRGSGSGRHRGKAEALVCCRNSWYWCHCSKVGIAGGGRHLDC